MKLFGRRRAKALAAGTIAPEEVFITGDPVTGPVPIVAGSAPDTTAASGPDAAETSGPETPAGSRPDSPAGSGPDTGGYAGGGVNGAPSSPAKLRFGFEDGQDSTPGVTVLAPAAVGAPTPSPSAAAATGELPVSAISGAARKVVPIGFGDELEEIETTTFDPSPVELPRPGVDPRLRARRIQVRRDEGRKRLRWAVLGGVVAAVLIGAGLVLESPLFAVNDVQVTGAAYTDPAGLQQVVDDLRGSTLLGADLGKAEAMLAADPWVKRVRVERRPLRGVRIEIVERVPATTYMGADQRWRVLDADGRVLAVLDPPGSKPVDPLELALPSPGPDLEPGATVPASLAGAASVVPRLPAGLRSRTCSLSVGDDGRLRMTLCDGFVIDLGSPERLRDKLVTTIFVLNTRADDVAASSGLNVGDPERPVLIQK